MVGTPTIRQELAVALVISSVLSETYVLDPATFFSELAGALASGVPEGRRWDFS